MKPLRVASPVPLAQMEKSAMRMRFRRGNMPLFANAKQFLPTNKKETRSGVMNRFLFGKNSAI
jgi:hypothetical protein